MGSLQTQMNRCPLGVGAVTIRNKNLPLIFHPKTLALFEAKLSMGLCRGLDEQLIGAGGVVRGVECGRAQNNRKFLFTLL